MKSYRSKSDTIRIHNIGHGKIFNNLQSNGYNVKLTGNKKIDFYWDNLPCRVNSHLKNKDYICVEYAAIGSDIMQNENMVAIFHSPEYFENEFYVVTYTDLKKAIDNGLNQRNPKYRISTTNKYGDTCVYIKIDTFKQIPGLTTHFLK